MSRVWTETMCAWGPGLALQSCIIKLTVWGAGVVLNRAGNHTYTGKFDFGHVRE